MTRASTFDEITSLNRAWVDLLRANCLTLVERPGAANGVSVSRGFADGADTERDAVIVLAQRMAGEYGLETEISIEGHLLTIRFTRAGEGQHLQSRKGAFLVERARALTASSRAREPADAGV